MSTVGELLALLDGLDPDLPVLVQMPGTRASRIEEMEKYEDAIVLAAEEPR